MNKNIQDKMKRNILVIKNSILFSDTKRESKFYNIGKNNFEEKILKNFKYMERGVAEVNEEYKQPIGYGIIINEKSQIFVYKRGGEHSTAGDNRMYNKVSVGVGGHIEKEEENSDNPIKDTLIREVEEEINLKEKNIKEIINIGYINDDDTDVGKFHIGACYVILVTDFKFELLDGEIFSGEFIDISEYEKMVDSGKYKIETWSIILLESLKKYLNKN